MTIMKLTPPDLKFIKITDHRPKYDPDYLNSLRKKVNSWIKKIDKEKLLDQLRRRNGEESTLENTD